MLPAKFIDRYRIDNPDRFRLADVKTSDTAGLNLDKDEAKDLLKKDAERLGELQERLYAEDKWAVLVVLQGMDTAGKDGVIEHVMAGVNPQGCIVHAFKAPSAEELEHDFLWRAAQRLPERGRIGIFNRSYYEEVLVVRVHPEMLAQAETAAEPHRQGYLEGAVQEHPRLRAPPGAQWHDRPQILPAHLARRSSASGCWPASTSPPSAGSSMPATSPNASSGTSTWRPTRTRSAPPADRAAPWYVVPADSKPFARLVVARAIVEALERLDLKFPKVGAADLKEMEKIREALAAEGPSKSLKGRKSGRTAS